jgi:hypothetical protein
MEDEQSVNSKYRTHVGFVTVMASSTDSTIELPLIFKNSIEKGNSCKTTLLLLTICKLRTEGAFGREETSCSQLLITSDFNEGR